jgi:hypothetical protein
MSAASVRRLAAGALAVVAASTPAGCGNLLGPKATLGPGAIVRARSLYNDVINETNNAQILEAIVRVRYGEPIGLLSVASVTASLRVSTTEEAQFGFGPRANYEGNILPLSIGIAYEDNPTISYVPVQGERYAKSLLTPVGLDALVLLLGIERAPDELVAILVTHLNGLQNPSVGPPESRRAFRDTIALLERLHNDGLASWTATEGGGYALVLHDYQARQRDAVRALLRALRLPATLDRDGHDLVLPLRLGVGTAAGTTSGLVVQTRSVYDLLAMASQGVEIPPAHAERGIATPAVDGSPITGLFSVRSSRTAPGGDVLAATHHRGHWFFIAANDQRSKLVFRILQVLMGMRLVDATPHGVPTLTIPVK